MVRLVRLKLIRQRKALTQQQLAAKAGVNRATISRLEAGTDQPFPTTVRKLADALEVEPETLLGPLAGSVTLDDHIVIINRPEVDRFFQREPGLAMLVSEAATQIVNFIPDASLSLEFLVDPDYGDGEQLFLKVSTRLEDNEAVEALRHFDQEWLVHHVRQAHGLLCIDLSDE